MPMIDEGIRIHIEGIVQGVGFRPFVYGLAQRYRLPGWVCNTSAGVDIQVDGPRSRLDAFVTALKNERPPLATIFSIDVTPCQPDGYTKFEIIHSQAIPGAFQPISPDVCTCPDCLRELFDPADRRYRYPFINCTNCGPRFTIIRDIPYDRPNTTMSGFPFCPRCAAEYADPLDRRFHAQPVACPTCGPQVWLEYPGDLTSPIPGDDGMIPNPRFAGDSALLQAQQMLAAGKIIAIKGLGGFHLACDAANPAVVDELRRRKLRVDKPFAVMLASIQAVPAHCRLSPAESDLLQSTARPIVILERLAGSTITPQTAPGQNTIGVMLPYTPLHALLFAPHPDHPGFHPAQALVMTSGNLSDEPIAVSNLDARQRLGSIADAFLMHNRPIHTRCDDSVMRSLDLPASQPEPAPVTMPLRRSRGYAPYPVRLPFTAVPAIAVGAEVKNTFCLTRDRLAFISHHIGDLENYETLQSFQSGIQHYEKLFKINPEIIACDLHPDYLATRYALERAECQNLPLAQIQHHHAHIAACMAENDLPPYEPVIGVAFDGTGYGEDGAIWGGEFLIVDYTQYRRAAHLAYVPLPGGDAAIRQPARAALAHLWQAGLDWDPDLPAVSYFCAEDRILLHSQLEHNINTPQTSSMGRLFDAVSALTGIRPRVSYEAQAAIEFEVLVDPAEMTSYNFEIIQPPAGPGGNSPGFLVSPSGLIAAVVADITNQVPVSCIAARFHNAVANMVVTAATQIKQVSGLNSVVLSGGVWQNNTLLKKTVELLNKHGFQCHFHTRVPPNDGGLALGQAVIALSRLQ